MRVYEVNELKSTIEGILTYFLKVLRLFLYIKLIQWFVIKSKAFKNKLVVNTVRNNNTIIEIIKY